MRPVLRGDLDLVERDRPRDGRRLVGEIEEGVRRVRRPVVVHKVGVGVRFERLVRIADAARHEDGARRVDLRREDAPEGLARPQIDPGAEDPAGGDGDPLVPRFGMDAAGGADRVVERDVVLHGTEVRKAGGDHLLALPVLLEPAAGITVHREVDEEQAGDRRLGDRERLAERGHHCPGRRRTTPWRPWPAPTSPRSRGTTRWWRRGPTRSRRTRRPAELGAQLRGVDGVAQIVTGAVRDVVVGVGGLAHLREDQLDDGLVVLLAVGADQVRLADLALLQDREDGRGVVVGMDPVAHVLSGAVQQVGSRAARS